MESDGDLPSSDAKDMKVCHMSILGATDALDPAIVPCIEEEFSRCDTILGNNKPHSLESQSFEHSDAFRNSEWGSESSGSIDDDWRTFKLPIGVDGGYITVGDLINWTPTDNVSKVMLEEKVYTTWYHGRTVLMGDGSYFLMPDEV
ncbi:hypothetical protein BGX27_003687 [Mortierella sp. AM989]|nr:hypothetical protein BGX27_003687 [Mortierella sp. AM989]